MNDLEKFTKEQIDLFKKDWDNTKKEVESFKKKMKDFFIMVGAAFLGLILLIVFFSVDSSLSRNKEPEQTTTWESDIEHEVEPEVDEELAEKQMAEDANNEASDVYDENAKDIEEANKMIEEQERVNQELREHQQNDLGWTEETFLVDEYSDEAYYGDDDEFRIACKNKGFSEESVEQWLDWCHTEAE